MATAAMIITARKPASMKALPKRKGNILSHLSLGLMDGASMKALPKRKGNITPWCIGEFGGGLNESPSKKEGKYHALVHWRIWRWPQ